MSTKAKDDNDMDAILKKQRAMNNDPPPLEDHPEKSSIVEGNQQPWQICLLDAVNSKGLAVIMILLTIYALFGDDVRLTASEKPDDGIFFTLSIIALFFFTLELTLNMLAKPGYVPSFSILTISPPPPFYYSQLQQMLIFYWDILLSLAYIC